LTANEPRFTMSTEVDEPALATDIGIPPGIDMVITLDIGPNGLDRYLELVGDRRIPLIKYHEGSLTLVSPSYKHERGAERIDGVIKAICAVLVINYRATASTLFRRSDRDHGIEADRSYYIASEPAIRGIEDEIDLTVYPPPDLMIEAVATHSPGEALAICREMGVPEVWVYWVRRKLLQFLHLDDQGQYQARPSSRAFPFLTPTDILPWVLETTSELDNLWETRLRAWVREELAPRRNR
jgi:Uma2 family endonuclease